MFWYDSGNFSVRGYLPLIWKDTSTHMLGLRVYGKEGLPFAWDLPLVKLCRFLLMFFTVFASLSVLPLLITFFVFVPSFLFYLLMFLSLETLTSIKWTGVPILLKLIDLLNSVIIFLSQITLFRWLTFLLTSQTDSHSPEKY